MILNVAIVATGLRYFASMISGVKWTVKPPAAAPKDDKNVQPGAGPGLTAPDWEKACEYANCVRMNMQSMDVPWYKVVRTAGQFKWIGMNIQECVARRMEGIAPGYIGIGTVEHRPAETISQWYLEPQSNYVLGWEQRDPNTNEQFDLDRDRCIYLVDDTLTSSPDGVGLLRHIVELCDELAKLTKLEGQTYETDLRGIPVGYAPTAVLDDWVARNRLTRAQADSKLSGLKDFIENHMKNPKLGVLLDSGAYTSQDHIRTVSAQRMWMLELLKGNGIGLAEINTAIQRKTHEIARALGVESFMLGAESKGSLALSEDKSRSLIELIKATLTEIAWCLQKDYVGKIFELNRWDKKLMPELMPDAVALRSVSQIVDAISKLALAGATLDRNDPLINQIRGMLNLVDQPEITPEMIAATMPPNDGGDPGDPKSKNPPKKPPKYPKTAIDGWSDEELAELGLYRRAA